MFQGRNPMNTTKLDPLQKAPETPILLLLSIVGQNNFHVSYLHPVQLFHTNFPINWSHSSSEILNIS